MRPDEARVLIALLPEELRDRADTVRRHTYRHGGCDRCRAAGEAMVLSLTAVHYDDLPMAEDLLDRAEHLVGGHSHGDAEPRTDRNLLAGLHGEVRGYRPYRPGPTGAPIGGQKTSGQPIGRQPIGGQPTGGPTVGGPTVGGPTVGGPAGGGHAEGGHPTGRSAVGGSALGGSAVGRELVAATDASWKGSAGGYAYVTSDGRWGLRSHSRYHLDPTGPSRALVNELRAVEFLLAAVEAADLRITVLVDSAPALGFLAHWRTGDTSRMPRGYSLRPRNSGPPTLVRLADRISRTHVVFQHVKGHDGHPLNEAADSLSAMARRWVGEHFDVTDRANGLVTAFLRDWHAAAVSVPGDRPHAVRL
jgi:ribonuclease HI